MPCDPDELRHVPLFELLDDDEAAVLAAQVEIRRFAARQRIFRMGDAAEHGYIVLSGKVRVVTTDEDDQEVVVDERGPARFSEGVREEVRIVEPRNRGVAGETVPIPCHFVRIGDILILQGRPCQVIRITVSPQTGQHRYLGVDLFTRQLQEESSFVSNPSPSVVVQTMLGPVYKTYRILDLRDDGKIVAMTETGDVKQGLPVITQGSLFKRIRDAFSDGRGSVRALVINDGGRELVVDFKVIHGSRL